MTKQIHPDAWQRENYKGAHRKGELFWHGEKFIMVKEKIDGKPHPKWFALLTVDYQPVAVGSKRASRGNYGPQTIEAWQALLQQHYPTTDAGRAALKSELERILND